jgi:TRAP-type mannitol/chloroaromatic compound transport system substrate-binding protein
MGSKRRAAGAQLLRFFRPPFLPPLRLAFFPALEIAAARDFGMGHEAGDRRERGAQTHRRSQTWNRGSHRAVNLIASPHRRFTMMKAILAASLALLFAVTANAQTKSVKVQSTWPASITLQDHLRILAERIDKLTQGQVKIETLAAGQIVPAFEVLDATNKKVLDGFHAISYYWVGKNPAAALFAGPPGGPFGMDHMDFLGWLYVGGGLEMWRDFYQNDLKLNVTVWPAHPSSPQALGWFKKPLKSVADFKGMKCRQTGLNAEVYAKLGQSVVNMAGGEIVPAAQRGVIDCAEWVGGVEDLRLGLPGVF